MTADSPLTKDINAAFQSDWERAQDLYQQGLKAGYETADADALYLDPIRKKWAIADKTILNDRVASVADGKFDNESTKTNFDKFQQESTQAFDRFHADVKAGYQIPEAEARQLSPFQQKWIASAALPEQPKQKPMTAAQTEEFNRNDPALRAEVEEFKKDESRMPLAQNLEQHPLLTQMSPFKSVYRPLYLSALRAEQRAGRPASIAHLLSEKKRLENDLLGTPGLTKDAAASIQQRLTQLNDLMGELDKGDGSAAAPQAPGATAPPGPVPAQSEPGMNSPFDPRNSSPFKLGDTSTATAAAPAARPAMKGYKVGAVYRGGLKYLGGDPFDQASWEKQ